MLEHFFERNLRVDLDELHSPIPLSRSELDQKGELGDEDKFSIPTPVLLYQAGYLTIKHVEAQDALELGLPNLEVKRSLTALSLRRRKMQQLDTQQRLKINRLGSYLKSGNLPEIARALNLYLKICSFDADRLTHEHSFRNLIYGCLLGADFEVYREVKASDGRCDLEVILRQDHLRCVFEFKLSKQRSDDARVLKSALEQLQKSHYGELPPLSFSLLRIAVVIGLDSHRVEAIAAVDEG
ncbi:MAG: PD-(D/E)XK nuclease domain-containing protein [Succinivibrio sp.]|nr:PD-(D/E)XK nuclease domain-containing protein [Succinivibrio sp.]